MSIQQKSYADVGNIIRPESAAAEGEVRKAVSLGDMREQWDDADHVLHNWIEVAVFNIGISATLHIMQRASESISR
ncbi:hypothetical protein A9320_17815 [Ruegeria sp. PBVC088]|nr:hypothetical protein A9320_17815 [Ruegeria sp. PBVC088]